MLELACNEYGEDGAPLIVMHGLFGSARAGIARALAETRKSILDLRNHGASPRASTMTCKWQKMSPGLSTAPVLKPPS